jgi:hypothetical protein
MSALVNVLLVVGLQVGDLAVMVASHYAQSQSPFTWYSFTEEPGTYVSDGVWLPDCADAGRAAPIVRMIAATSARLVCHLFVVIVDMRALNYGS